MPGHRTFDYELLKRLVQEHPDWSNREYARALTEDMRGKLKDPKYPMVMPNTVAAAIYKNRDRWADEGVKVPPDRRSPVYSELIPAGWKVPERFQMHTHLRKLRTIARLRRGLETNPKEARQALQFERTLKENKQVVDLGSGGRPIIRPAEPWELNDDGELIEVVAQPVPPDAFKEQARSKLVKEALETGTPFRGCPLSVLEVVRRF